MNYRLLIPALILLLASSVAPAEDVATDAESFSGIYVKAADSEYDWDSQSFHAQGNAIIRYNDITLSADSVTGNAGTGDFEADGNVTFIQGDRTLKGNKFNYNYKTKLGHTTNAAASADKVFFHGKELDSKPDGYTLTGSTFTTCDREKPHYYMAARELIIRPGDKLIARGVRLVVLGKTLMTLPKYTVGLKPGERRSLNLPSLGVSTKYGAFIRQNLAIETNPGLSGELALRLSAREAFQGGIKLSEVASRPITLNFTYREPYYAGRSSDTLLSRLPEVAYRFYGKGTPITDAPTDDSLYLSRTVLDPTRNTKSGGKLNFIAEAGAGHFKEEPSLVEATRVDLRAMAWLDPVQMGGISLMPGMLGRYSHYSTGDDYGALGFQLAAARKLGSDSFISLTYVNHAISGGTPFEFDPIEIPQELAGRLRFPIAGFALELAARYDMKQGTIFDSSVSLSKPVHCIEPTITWRNRFRELSFDVGLVAF